MSYSSKPGFGNSAHSLPKAAKPPIEHCRVNNRCIDSVMFFPFANLLILGEWRFEQMEPVVLFDPEAELDQFTIAKAKATAVVVLH